MLINMNRYREGDRLKEGAMLERITPQGVVLSYQGEQFRYDRP
ncbi:MAG TPA: general secretion pathway protein GspB [Gammaproteobacteria bacterium]